MSEATAEVAPGSEGWFLQLDRELRGFVRRRVADPVAAEDVLQDALLRIARGLDGLRDEERLAAWTYAVARSAVQDHYRRAGRPERPQADLDDGPAPGVEGGGVADGTPAASRVLAGWLPSALDALPEPYRTTLRATEIEGQTHAELAAREGVSVSAIKSRVSRGRRKLRQAAERCCEITLDARGKVIGLRPRHCGCEA